MEERKKLYVPRKKEKKEKKIRLLIFNLSWIWNEKKKYFYFRKVKKIVINNKYLFFFSLWQTMTDNLVCIFKSMTDNLVWTSNDRQFSMTDNIIWIFKHWVKC